MPSVLHVRPSKILGVGLNYRAHAAEMKKALPR
jgi:2-keto-4-pentenoate hydratase/2-oxohepta-3-ene-1,7-dioic acid hydratase in catechol pathway